MNARTKIHSLTNVILIAVLLAGLASGAHPLKVAQAAPALQAAPDETIPAVENVTAAQPEGDWLAAVQQDIQQREYHVTWSEQTGLANLPAAYQAPNRAQNLRTYFSESGPRLIPRQGEAGQPPAWELGMHLSAYGREEALQAVGKALHSAAQDERFSYQYANIEEWYLNRTEGLEQGFTLSERPTGSSQLALEIHLSGNLTPHLSEDNQTIQFTTPSGVTVLRYDHLHATDAAGKELPSRLSLAPLSPKGRGAGGEGALLLLVNDTGAQYPLTIDPLASTPSWSAEGNQIGAYFGVSVSTAGDVNGDGYSDVIVGAHFYDNGQTDEGAVFVYHGSATGLSTTANWTAESDQASALFGISVSTAGDVNGDGYADVIVGTPYYDNGQTDEGAAYVYLGSASGLSTTAAWSAESNQEGDAFGYSVGTAGDVNGDGYADVIVGAFGYSNGQTNEGAAFVYHGSASGLSTTAAWNVESNQASACLGQSVATAGDVNGDGYADVIVGAHSYDTNQGTDGVAFVYHGSASGLGTSAAWSAESNQVGANLGNSVATAGDVNGDGYADVIVGASLYDNGQTNEGAAFVYLGSASGLNTTAAWSAESNQAHAHFGRSVSAAGDVNGDGYADVIVGTPYYDNGQPNEGVIFVYPGSASGLSVAPLTANGSAEGNQTNANLGNSVATAGDVNGDGYADVIVGALNYYNGQIDEGGAFVYHGSASGLSATANWTAESDQASAFFGFSVSTAGDVNGDGYADVIVGAPGYDNGQANEGGAWVYYGSAPGLSTTAGWMAESDQVAAQFGFSVGTAGDVNGDGYADVIVGANGYGNGQNSEGCAYVYYGSASGLSVAPLTANWTAESDQVGAYFGNSVGTAGDVNGDGYADVIIGAPNYDNGQSDEGAAFVYHGSASGLNTTPNWMTESNQASTHFGYSVSTAGDVNGDGYADIIVGAYSYDNGQTDEGVTFAYHGSASGLGASAAWSAEGNQISALLGYSVATAGDVNGDGYADVIIGAYGYDNGQTDEGGAFVYHGSAAGLSTTAAWTAESDQASAFFGFSVGAAGDVNGDGYADVIVGAPGYDNGQTDEGYTSVYHGSASGLTVTALTGANWAAESDQANANFGRSVGTAGDVNGDGYADVIVGAPYYDNGQSDEGSTFIHYGNGGKGLALRLQARRSDNSAPIQPGGLSDSVNSFRLAALGRTPFGRGKVKLEWEVKPLGTPFDGAGLGVSIAWTDTYTTGMALNELVSILASRPNYHWRLRLRYHPVTTPFQQYSRWVTQPWNGWNESDLRLPFYTLTMHKAGNGTLSPDVGNYSYPGNTVVTTTATADPGWTFTGWSGDLSGTSTPTTITMDSSKEVTATFTQDHYTLNVSTIGNGAVSKNPDQPTYTYGTVVTLTATTDPGWSFTGWNGDVAGTANPIQITMNGNRSVTATFILDLYTLNVSTVGSGAVSKNPNQAAYTYGMIVTLTAAADPGWTFAGWSGDLSGTTNPTQITMDSNKAVTATFTQNQYTLSTSVMGSGTVAKNPDQASYVYGDVVTLTATADPGWTFSGWSGNLSGTANPTGITIESNMVVTATFTQDEYTLNVNTVGNGAVSKNPDQATYVYGDVVTLTATTYPGWTFAGWSGDLSGTTNPTTITMNGNRSVTATFILDLYTLDVSIIGSGSVAKSPDQATYHYGEVVTLTATADPGWTFSGWSGDLSGTATPTTITMDSPKEVTATFTQNEYTLTTHAVGSGSVAKSPDQATYHYGEVVTLTATADPGWTFAGWSGDLSGTTAVKNTANPIQITMDGNKTVTATFIQVYPVYLPLIKNPAGAAAWAPPLMALLQKLYAL